MAKIVMVICLAAFGLCPIAFAGNNPSAKGAVHVLPHASRTCAEDFPHISGCQDITTTEPSPDADCFPVFYDLAEFQGCTYGLIWPGQYTCAFTSCSDLAIIAVDCSWNSHQWYTCQPGPVAMPGWAQISAHTTICLVEHSWVDDCHGERDYLVCKSCAGVGGYIGDDPCRPTAGEPTMLSSIKGMFR